MTVAACGGAPGTVQPVISGTLPASNAVPGGQYGGLAASASASAVPPGYKSTGDAARGISVAIPDSWIAVHLTAQDGVGAMRRLGLTGANVTETVQYIEAFQQQHGVFVLDIKYGRANPDKFTPDLNAFCNDSGVPDVGAAAVALIKNRLPAVYQSKFDATHITEKDVEVGGVPGLESSYQESTKLGTIYTWQLVVLPKPNDGCYVTMEAGEGVPMGSVVSTAAATARFT